MTNLGRLLAMLVLTSACGVGDDDMPTPPSTPEPRLCSTDFSIAGQFTLGMPVPDEVNNETGMPPGDGMPDINGCWPIGTWTFTLTQTANTCDPAPTPAASYSFRTDYVDGPGGATDKQYQHTLLSPTGFPSTNWKVKVSSGGGGLCEGGIELYSADGKQSWNLHPAIDVFNTSGPIEGFGEYAEWADNQIPM